MRTALALLVVAALILWAKRSHSAVSRPPALAQVCEGRRVVWMEVGK